MNADTSSQRIDIKSSRQATFSQPRCINLDWLECYCLEPVEAARDAEYFRNAGWDVQERDYGTRIYNEMFTLIDPYGYKYIEVRRAPKSADQQGGIMPFNACHIRLANRTCYFDNAADIMSKFISQHNFLFQRISRVDIALDFEKFDSGDDPQKFLYRYMKGKFAKINQSNIHAHGTDTWAMREWNSLSWGSKNSQVGTKFYCKTKELAEVSDKPYIRQAWFITGLIDDPQAMTKKQEDGQLYKPEIWRVEFSIKSDVKNWMVIEQGGQAKKLRSIRNTLDMYNSKIKLIAMFNSLQQHYFHFKYFKQGENKYKCADKILFNFGTQETTYKVEHPASDAKPDNKLLKLLNQLQAYKQTVITPELHQACDTIIETITNGDMSRLLEHRWSRDELLALQQAISLRLQGSQADPADIINEIKSNIQRQTLF